MMRFLIFGVFFLNTWSWPFCWYAVLFLLAHAAQGLLKLGLVVVLAERLRPHGALVAPLLQSSRPVLLHHSLSLWLQCTIRR